MVQQESKTQMIDRLGGQAQYEMAVFDLCDRMIEDPDLSQIYGNFDAASLSEIQKEMLDLAFLSTPQDREKLECRVVLHHYRLFELGLNEKHFDVIEEHLVESLRHAWVSEDAISEATKRFEVLRRIFAVSDRIAIHQDNSSKVRVKSKDFTREKVERSGSGEGLLDMLRESSHKRSRRGSQ